MKLPPLPYLLVFICLHAMEPSDDAITKSLSKERLDAALQGFLQVYFQNMEKIDATKYDNDFKTNEQIRWEKFQQEEIKYKQKCNKLIQCFASTKEKIRRNSKQNIFTNS